METSGKAEWPSSRLSLPACPILRSSVWPMDNFKRNSCFSKCLNLMFKWKEWGYLQRNVSWLNLRCISDLSLAQYKVGLNITCIVHCCSQSITHEWLKVSCSHAHWMTDLKKYDGMGTEAISVTRFRKVTLYPAVMLRNESLLRSTHISENVILDSNHLLWLLCIFRCL